MIKDEMTLHITEAELARDIHAILARVREEGVEVIVEHGLHRAQTPEQARSRRNYLDTVFAAIPVEPFTREMAQIAAKVDTAARKTGCAAAGGRALSSGRARLVVAGRHAPACDPWAGGAHGRAVDAWANFRAPSCY